LEEKKTEADSIRQIIDSFTEGNIWKHVSKGMSKGMATLLNKIEKISIGPVDINLSQTETQEDFYKNLKPLNLRGR
jgi:hypothetical protein